MNLRIAVLAPLLLALAGCGGEKDGAGAPAKEVRLGYFANLTHAQAVLGVASGDFGKAIAPATLKTHVFNAGPSLIEALLAGEIDIGYVGPGPAITGHGRTQGRGVRVIAGASANGVIIVARKDAGITTLEEIRGKRIATPQVGNTQDIAARHYLTSVLKQADLANVVPIPNAEQAGLMKRKQIDVAWAPEPWGSRLLAEADGVIVAEEKNLWPNKEVNLAVVITTPRFLKEHPDVVEKMLKVHRKWTARLAADPSGHVDQLASALHALTGNKLPEGVLARAVGHVKFTDDPLEETLAAMAQWTHELGFSPQPIVTAGLADLTILRKLQEAK